MVSTASDTIFAVASGAGRAAIGIVRISGAGTAALLRHLTRRPPPPPRRASLRRLLDGAGQTLDQCIVVWLPGPASYTGEDAAELHVHGGSAVIEGVALELADLGARPSEPGEFSRRAFLNGRMELTEAEAVADLVEAETIAQRNQALRQLDGALAQVFDSLAHDLKQILAEQEALIDFPDDAETVGDHARIEDLIGRLDVQMADDQRGERLREGLNFAVVGPSNAGKSSLINALSGKDAAIVAPTPGTTRDILEVRTIFGGVPVTLLDTAGVRDSDDPVEREGIRRARDRAATASLVIAVSEAAHDGDATRLDPTWLLVDSKTDLVAARPGRLGVSLVTGTGLAELRAALDAEARRLTHQSGPAPLTRARHRAACRDALHHLRAALQTQAAELRAEELRLAMGAVGRVTGRVGVEDVLDVVFSRFCIGK